MKTFKALAIAMILAVIGAMPAAAQIQFGPRVGFTTSKLHFDKSGLDSRNMTGFTGGLMASFTVPIIGIGGDASVMYMHRGTQFVKGGEKTGRDYIEIPVNIKYNFSIPAVGSLVSPYLFTGPSFAFLCSKKDINEFVQNKSCDIAWNFGLGVKLINHLCVSASYGIGLNSAVESKLKAGVSDAAGDVEIFKAKDRFWTVTAAWLF